MAECPQTAMVLAAGLGTRMRPLTDDRPKPLVAVAGRPLIDHVLDGLADAGITTAVVNVHYLAEVLIAHLQGRSRPRIVISDERDGLLDTGGGVARALPLLGAGPFVIHNSDSIWSGGHARNIARLMTAFDPGTMDSLMLLAPVDRCIGYTGRGDFEMAGDGRLQRRRADQMARFAFTGVSIATPALLADAPAGAFSLNQPWNRAIAAGRLAGLEIDGTWMHVGDPQAVTAAAERLAADG